MGSEEYLKNIPAYYSPYILQPSSLAVKIYRENFRSFSESFHIQCARTPAFMEYVIRNKESVADSIPSVYTEYPDLETNLPYFIRWDQRWANIPYAAETMAEAACGPVSLSMVYTGLSKKNDFLPVEMAAWATRESYACDFEGSEWALMDEGARKLGLESEIVA